MADRFWVGGTGTWDTTSTTHWSASSGGANGASVPTDADNVFLDGNSGGGVITIGGLGDGICHDLDCTGFTGTLTGSSIGLDVFGSFILATGMTFSLDGFVAIYSADADAKVIHTHGKTLTCRLYVDGEDGSVSLLADLALSASNFLQIGQTGPFTFDANDKNVEAGAVAILGGDTISVLMGSGTWTLLSADADTDADQTWTSGTITDGLTLDFETSTILVKDSSGGNKILNFDSNLNDDSVAVYNLVIDPLVGNCVVGIRSSSVSFNSFTAINLADAVEIDWDGSSHHTFEFFNVSGSAGKLVSIWGGGTSDEVNFSLLEGIVDSDYLDLHYTIAEEADTWYAGSHSVDAADNTGWIFDDAPVEGHETADVAPVVAVFSAAAVTALFFISAIPPPVAATFSAPAVTATYVYVVTASASPVAANFSAPAVAASYIQIETASVAPTVAIFSAPAVTATYIEIRTASVSPVSAHWSAPQVDANILYSTEVISPVATPPATPKFTFLVESIDGTSFRYATENWEFDEITREVNGSMSVRIRTDQLTTDIARAITDLMNRITIRVSTANTGSEGIPYFTGFIPNRQLNLTAENQSVEIMAFGYATRLIDIPYRDDPTVAMDFTGGTKASDLSKDVIDKVREIDSTWPVNYTDTSVQDSVDTVKDIFKLSNALDVLNRAVLMASNFYWRILGDNIFTFKQSSATADHALTYGKNVVAFPQFTEDLIQAKNEIMVVYNGGANIKRVADTDNIALYGLRSLVVNENNVPDVDTAVEIGNAYLASLLAPLRTITVTVGSNYPIEFINPGDTCRIDNLPPDIAALLTNNLFIVKTTYHRDTVDLVLSIKPLSIQNKVQRLENKFNQQVTDDLGATTYS